MAPRRISGRRSPTKSTLPLHRDWPRGVSIAANGRVSRNTGRDSADARLRLALNSALQLDATRGGTDDDDNQITGAYSHSQSHLCFLLRLHSSRPVVAHKKHDTVWGQNRRRLQSNTCCCSRMKSRNNRSQYHTIPENTATVKVSILFLLRFTTSTTIFPNMRIEHRGEITAISTNTNSLRVNYRCNDRTHTIETLNDTWC